MTTEAFIQEFEQEAATTRRVLERVPEDRLAWRPHPKSMSLGALALHVASVPAFISGWATQDSVELSGDVQGPPEPKSRADILAVHDEGVQKTKDAIRSLGDEGLTKPWAMKTKDGTLITSMPKGALIRTVLLNHSYHHRGQLSVYLRLLDVPVPSIYGPSADEAPFARA